ncbi:MAG: outer membrane protein TolC [Cyclobacteriaceae bacterium]|jgi:outer membrane protein TolC
MKNVIALLLCVGCWFQSLCQAQNPSDSLSLNLYEVLDIVAEYHPLVRQANLQPGFAEAELRTARGLMDPKIGASFDQKMIKGTQYHQKFNSALKVPVWFPIDPKIELSNTQGVYLNEEDRIFNSENWQVIAGVSLPIGKGLFIDERRSTIQQAKFYTDLAQAEQTKAINKVLFTVIKSYWEWYFSYQNFNLMSRSIGIAQELFNRTKIDFAYGEAAVIDTVQALITLQSRIVDFEKAKLERQKAGYTLSIHLWGPNDIPVEIDNLTVPVYAKDFGFVPQDSSIQKLIVWSSKNHPDILKLGAKKEQLEIEERWNKESLKPEINLSYSLIDAPISYDGYNTPDWNDSYKLGVDFAFPLFLRKERGKLQKTQLYIESTDYSIDQIVQEIDAEVKAAFAELKTSKILADQYSDMAKNYETLLQAEIFNLENGESDLFKLNIQQEKYLEAQRKYYDADLKFQKLKVSLPYVIGLPDLSYKAMYE